MITSPFGASSARGASSRFDGLERPEATAPQIRTLVTPLSVSVWAVYVLGASVSVARLWMRRSRSQALVRLPSSACECRGPQL
jgi:hypothetical protein